jgi:hypothetical protein
MPTPQKLIDAAVKDFDKWFNHGTKEQPHGLLASSYYKEVQTFWKVQLTTAYNAGRTSLAEEVEEYNEEKLKEKYKTCTTSEFDNGYFWATKDLQQQLKTKIEALKGTE